MGKSMNQRSYVRTMLSSLDHFLCEKGKYYSILKDRKFATSRRVLNGKAIELRERGYGKRNISLMHLLLRK